MMEQGDTDILTNFERAALTLGRRTNETALGKKLQIEYLARIVRPMVVGVTKRRMYISNWEWLKDWQPERGMLMAANHRTFYDCFLLMSALFALHPLEDRWFDRIYFPVRANFFYETKVGLLLNYLIGGGSLYPPIFRDKSKKQLNQIAVEKVNEFLSDPQTVVGVHPEGTRGKTDDPYNILPAKPGVGHMTVHARPVVMPSFINGLGNDFLETVKRNFRPDIRREEPIIMHFGDPLDYSEYLEEKPSPALYQKVADRIRDEIIKCGEIERDIRRRCVSGEISDDDPNWMSNIYEKHHKVPPSFRSNHNVDRSAPSNRV